MRRLLMVLVILTAVLAAYTPAMRAGFIWDDDAHLTHNRNMLDVKGLRQVWTSSQAFYCPLTLTTFWAVRHFWGLDPFPYHLLNILLHTANAILLGMVLCRLGIPGALFAAALFALHPVHVESVAWVSELKNVQSGFFYLLAILCFLKRDTKGLYYGAAIFLFALSLLSKPVSVMLPVVLMLIIWWQRRPCKKKAFFSTAPFFVLAFLAAGWTVWEQTAHSGAIGPEWSLSGLERAGLAGKTVWFYLWKLIWPHPLVFIYPRWNLDPMRPDFYLGTAALLACAYLFYRWRAGRLGAPVWFAAAYFAASLFPVMGFFNIYFMRYSFVADHFQYLASMGPIALLAGGIWNGQRHFALRSTISIALILALMTMTWRQAFAYRDIEVLWRDTVGKSPDSWLAQNNLANLLLADGRREQAIRHYLEALRAKPDFAEAHTNLGVALNNAGRLEEAIGHFTAALRYKPGTAEVHDGFGNALANMGKTEEAINHYEQAIRLKPDFAASHNNLGLVYIRQGKIKEGIAEIKQALAIDPNLVQAQDNLAIAERRLSQSSGVLADG